MIYSYIVNLTYLLLVLVSSVSALPAPPCRDIAWRTVRLSPGTEQVPGCSINEAASATRPPLERRQEFLTTRASTGRSAKMSAIIDERRNRRRMRTKQHQAAVVVMAKQRQEWPPFVIENDGTMRLPDLKNEEDVSKKVRDERQKKIDAKKARTTAYNNLSPEEKLRHEEESKEKDKKRQEQHIKENSKINTRKNRKEKTNERLAANLKYAKAAKAAYETTSGLPSRHETYTSPQEKPYTGKDVRQAVFNYHLAKAKGGIGYNGKTGALSLKKDEKLPKDFHNQLNKDPGREHTRPLSNVQAYPNNPLVEFPILHDKKIGYDGYKPNPSEARIIIQKDPQREGHHVLLGRVGHPHNSQDHVSF